MNILSELRNRLRAHLSGKVDNVNELLALVRPSADPKFGDYQANFAMPLGKQLSRNPREIAQETIAGIDVSDFCREPEIAGPGFINFRVRDEWIADQLAAAVNDDRLGAESAGSPHCYIIDYSSPNVAKPMHVGHIRSTVIGDSLCRTLRFLGHQVISDNHIGDWGTQFGMIIFGWKRFRNERDFGESPVEELARLYRLVNSLVEFYDAQKQLPELRGKLEHSRQQLEANQGGTDSQDKKAKKQRSRKLSELQDMAAKVRELEQRIDSIQQNDTYASLIASGEFENIGQSVLEETAKLHSGDEENRELWKKFLPPCLREIENLYQRIGISFDVTLGESYYHDQLSNVVEDLQQKGLAVESDGAICIFLEGADTPMLVRKQDGAFLYATTDLATIRYRVDRWHPDAILYVVDHRQCLHFEQLFSVAKLWGYDNVELRHVSFGTVLGTDGRPFKTRSGGTVGLAPLLDEAVVKARQVVESSSGDAARLPADERDRVAEVVGLGALKYADLSQNRESDYTFSYDKMMAMNGNTATYMQYAYARVRSIFAKGGVDVEKLRSSGSEILLNEPAERALGLQLLRFSEALELVADDYRPNQLTNYLFDLANRFSTFFEQCPVLKAPKLDVRDSRLLFCDLTARTIKAGLELLGIDVVERM